MNYLLLRNISWSTFGIVIAIVAALAAAFAALIVLVSKLCAVKEDEKAKAISEKLAGANCGGCGYAGCADFAKAVASGKADVSACGPTSRESKAEIAKILGLELAESEPAFAVVKCAGGNDCNEKFEYVGNEGCEHQANLLGGRKQCAFGCMGAGTCVKSCPYGAVKLVNGVAVIDKVLCENCGVCVRTCPKRIIGAVPKSAAVYVACSSLCKGKDVINACKAGCISCGLCAKNCPANAVEMVNGLAVIDYAKCTGCKTCVAKCPRKIIKEL